MRKHLISRRSFVQQAAVAGLLGSAAAAMGPSRLLASQSVTPREAELIAALQNALGNQVIGMEKNNGIAMRLAINLATMTGPKPARVARQQILLLAAEGIPSGHTSPPATGPRTVSQNLNGLLNTIRGQRAASQLIAGLLNAVATTVLFSTHGIQFDDTRAAHQAFRAAILELKNTKSDIPYATRIAEKRRLALTYKNAIHNRAKQVVTGGFPPAATIRSSWIMTDYKLPSTRKT